MVNIAQTPQLPKVWLDLVDNWATKSKNEDKSRKYPSIRVIDSRTDFFNKSNQNTESNPFNHAGKSLLSLSLNEIFDIWQKSPKAVADFLGVNNKSSKGGAYSAVFRRYISLLKIYVSLKSADIPVIVNELAEDLFDKLSNKNNNRPKDIVNIFDDWDIEEAMKDIQKKNTDKNQPPVVNGVEGVANLDNITYERHPLENYPRQIIFYGVPGNGKSQGLKKFLEEKEIEPIRCTFHPEMDYASFVGGYMPCSTADAQLKQYNANKADLEVQRAKMDKQSQPQFDIKYEFQPQTFINAYQKAWENQHEDVVLIIEEINRGNCAEIFGDVFQLLDRNKNGESEYPITPDCFLNDWLMNNVTNYNGQLILPNNLYIWATMNVSDQSLFPIDSAFFRRWEMRYVPVGIGDKALMIGNTGLSWEQVQLHINELMDQYGIPDKKLGRYFVKSQGPTISEVDFVGKVIFYLYKYIFPVYSIHEDLMKEFPFDSFYDQKASNLLKIGVSESRVKAFLEKLVGSADKIVLNTMEAGNEKTVETES